MRVCALSQAYVCISVEVSRLFPCLLLAVVVVVFVAGRIIRWESFRLKLGLKEVEKSVCVKLSEICIGCTGSI